MNGMALKNKAGLWPLILFVTAIMFINGSGVVCADSKSESDFQSMLKDELIYPRKTWFRLPATIKKEPSSNDLKIVRLMKSLDLLDFEENEKVIKILANSLDRDLIRKNMDIRYNLLGVNILLGEQDLRVINVKIGETGHLVEGEIFINNKSRVYSTIMEVLTEYRKDQYLVKKYKLKVVKTSNEEIQISTATPKK